MNQLDLFLHLASYAPWGISPAVPKNVFRVLESTLKPIFFDENDPPRRKYTGSAEDVAFWLTKHHPEAWGRYLFFERKGKNQSYYLCFDWIDFTVEIVRKRGDYNNIWGEIKQPNIDVAVELWKELCRVLHPFHAFLDTYNQYNRRAHKVLPDGTVSKTRGSYLKRIPGLFAFNFFGTVYTKKWGQDKLNDLPSELVSFTDEGFFLQSPSGLDLEDKMSDVYSPEDRAVIQTLGEEWFHLPDRPDLDHAPSLEEFIAATPQRPVCE